MIDAAEGEMSETCTSKGVSASTASYLCKAAVKALVKADIIDRGIFDGGILKALDRTSYRDELTSEKLRASAESLLERYAVSIGGSEINSSEDISGTIVREDHEMPNINPDQSKIKEYHDRASETGNQDTDLEDD